MLLTKTVKVKWHGNNRKWYEDRGYKYTKRGDGFDIKVEDVMPTQRVDYDIEVLCDICGCNKLISLTKYNNNLYRNNNQYLCSYCENAQNFNKYIDTKSGRLIIKEYLGHYKGSRKVKTHWFKCKCDCGNEVIKDYNYFFTRDFEMKSCGCWNSERTIQFNKETKTGFTNDYYEKDGYYYIKIIKKDNEVETIVEKDMFDYLKNKNRKLSLDCRGYAFITQEDTYGRQLFIHNLVVFGEDYYNKNMKILVDHINNKNILDNRKSNLRPATDSENNCNQKLKCTNTSGIKGLMIERPKDQNKPRLLVKVNKNHKRKEKSFSFNLEGLHNSIIWNINTRKEMHGEFANHGFDICNKSIEEIIEEQSKIFINNLNESDKYYFNNA